jgi:hypothetical protein
MIRPSGDSATGLSHINRCTGTKHERSFTMKLSQLLASRSAVLRQATLANAAFAYATLAGLDRHIRRARLSGPVHLIGIDASLGRYAPQLIALAGNQSVIEEHFDETDLVRLADALAYVSEAGVNEFEFRLEELMAIYAPPLRATLREAGVELDHTEPQNAPGDRQ